MAKKIFVCVKQVPDTETRFKLSSDAKSVDESGIKWVMNPYDEYAVEEALKIKAAQPDLQVVAVTVGPKKRTVEVLRTALAMGADDAIAIDCEDAQPTHASVAKALAKAIQGEGETHLVLAGKLAIDDNAAAVPQMVAEALGLPHVTIATKAEWSADKALISREIEGGNEEKVAIQLPAVVSCNKGLNTPRYPSLPGIMKAKKKPIKELALSSLGIEASSLQLVSFSNPPERPQTRILQGDLDAQVSELVKLLREDAKVL